MSRYSSKCGIERHLSDAHRDAADAELSAVNCSTVQRNVGSLSDGIAHIPQVPVMYNGSSDELMSEPASVPLVTVANQMTGSMAGVSRMPDVNEQLIPSDNAARVSLVEICVFSTILANNAAESVRTGRYDSIIDFHQDYCAAPVSQV